jgi:exopolysaccharide production protein ExoQ
MTLTWRNLEQAFAVYSIMLLSDGLALRSMFVASEGSNNVTSTVGGLDRFIALSQYAILAVTLIVLLTQWRRTVLVAMRNPLLILFAVYSAMSVYWSDFPAITTRSGLLYLSTTCFGIYLAHRYSLREQMHLVATAIGLLGLMSLLLGIVVPSAGIENNAFRQGAWRGVFYHKNNLGSFMYMGCISALLIALDRRRDYIQLLAWASCGLTFGLVVLSSSKTSLLIAVVLMSLIPFARSLRWQGPQLIPLLSGLTVLVGSVGVFLVENYESLLRGLGKDPTFSGRTDLWRIVIQSAMERPWFGFGYEAFWVTDAGRCIGECSYVRATLGFDATSAHNGYIDLLASLGIIGLAMFLVGMGIAYRRAIFTILKTQDTSGLWPFLYLISLLLFTQSESAVLADRSLFWALYVGLGLGAPGLSALGERTWRRSLRTIAPHGV